MHPYFLHELTRDHMSNEMRSAGHHHLAQGRRKRFGLRRPQAGLVGRSEIARTRPQLSLASSRSSFAPSSSALDPTTLN